MSTVAAQLFNFRWVIRGGLAGCAMPGLYRSIEEDLETLRKHGIVRLISLTQVAPPIEDASDISVVRLPIPDMAPPVTQIAAQACEAMLDAFESNEPVAIHCRAGVGRTGTLLGCFLTLGIADANRAMAQLRSVNPHYVQTESQAAFVEHWAEHSPESLRARAQALKHRF